jgi:uncharacterized damage-inducible protein DinB
MSDTTDWIKLNLPDLDPSQAKKLAKYIKQAKIDEVEAYADYLSDQDNEAAFEMAWNEYAYTRTRFLDNE